MRCFFTYLLFSLSLSFSSAFAVEKVKIQGSPAHEKFPFTVIRALVKHAGMES